MYVYVYMIRVNEPVITSGYALSCRGISPALYFRSEFGLKIYIKFKTLNLYFEKPLDLAPKPVRYLT